MTVTITAQRIGTAIRVDVANDTGTATWFTVLRLWPDGTALAVPGAYQTTPTTPNAFAVTDADVPQNTPLSYQAVALVAGVEQLSAVVPAAGGVIDRGADWLYAPDLDHPGTAVHVQSIGDWERRNDAVAVEVFRRPDPVVATWGRKTPRMTMRLITLDDAARVALLAVTEASVVALSAREPVAYGMPPVLYLSAATVTEERPSPLGTEQARVWSVQGIAVSRPQVIGGARTARFIWADRTPPGNDEPWRQWMNRFASWVEVAG